MACLVAARSAAEIEKVGGRDFGAIAAAVGRGVGLGTAPVAVFLSFFLLLVSLRLFVRVFFGDSAFLARDLDLVRVVALVGPEVDLFLLLELVAFALALAASDCEMAPACSPAAASPVSNSAVSSARNLVNVLLLPGESGGCATADCSQLIRLTKH